MSCRTCQAPWAEGRTVVTWGSRDADSVRHYCPACIADGKADAEEAELARWWR